MDILRKPKIPFTNGMILFDWAATCAAAYYISDNYYHTTANSSVLKIFLLLIVASIFIHRGMNIPTVTNYYLGMSQYPKR